MVQALPVVLVLVFVLSLVLELALVNGQGATLADDEGQAPFD